MIIIKAQTQVIKMNKRIKKLEMNREVGKVYVNDRYSIDIAEGYIDDLKNESANEYPQYVFDLRDDLRDIGLVA